MSMFPSFLRVLKQPKHQRFHIQPRYYDPIKEEIKERTQRIKKELDNGEIEGQYESRIKFKRRTKPARFTSLIQLFLAVYLGGLVLGWLQFGNDFLYYFMWGSLFIFLIYRLRRKRK